MYLDRIDLADIHAPKRMAAGVHGQLGAIDAPVPVVEIARALGIEKVRLDVCDGFEGMLLTDRRRSTGAIVANIRHGQRRARFTVAHELGHFLLERHVLSDECGFRCLSADLRETRDGKRHLRQETEANRFAIELLAPIGLVIPHLSPAPDLRDAQRVRDAFDISLEAAVRRMIDRRDEQLAAVWSYQGRVRYLVRDKRFPFVPLRKGDQLLQTSATFRVITDGRKGFTEFTESHSLAWTRNPELEMYEQTRLTQNGHAVTLLWAVPGDDGDESDTGVSELDMPGFR